MSQLKIHFKRTKQSQQKIFSGYHFQTGIFSLLSLTSYFSPQNAPIDRMGMLIVLYLIQMNTYNSVQAPQRRGFSLIETWFIGIQIPILIGILEYGVILALRKFWPIQRESTLKMIDLSIFFVSACYLVIFNGIYWFF